MKATQQDKQFTKTFEGLRLKPYLCSANCPTIGFGSTMYPNGRKVTLKDPAITKERADEIFDWHYGLFEKDVNFLIGKKGLTQNQYIALLDFAYNLGSDIDADNIPEGLGDSALLKKVLANPADPTIGVEFSHWNKSNGKPSKGLTIRRAAEAKLFFTP